MSEPRPAPVRGDVWRHYKGSYYIILAVAVDANNPSGVRDEGDRFVVVYRKIGTAQVYARAEAEFVGDTESGTPRFTPDFQRGGPGDLDLVAT